MARAGKLKVGNGLEQDVQMGPMIASRRLDAMDRTVSDAKARGADIALGGERPKQGIFLCADCAQKRPGRRGYHARRAVGPLAPTTSFSAYDDVIERANSLPFGLASFVFTGMAHWQKEPSPIWRPAWSASTIWSYPPPRHPSAVSMNPTIGPKSGIEGLEAYLRTKFVTEA
ncbi:MAG: aldehyde dehydrogenase family protein [Myxococcales bacterium]